MRTNYKLKLLTAFLMLFAMFYYSCKKDLSKTTSGLSNTTTSTISRAANETVNVWETMPDQSKLLAQQGNINFAADAGTNATTITVDETTTYQTIDGFGYCLTGGSASLINGLGGNQSTFLNDIFSTASGHVGSSFVRITIGASDLIIKRFN